MNRNIRVDYLSNDIINFRELSRPEGISEEIPCVDAYLVTGAEHAVLIDTLESVEGLYDEVRKITNLPLSVLITHGHPDHAGKALEEFVNAGIDVYMNMKDYEWLHRLNHAMCKEWFKDMQAGMKFDLGGKSLSVISCPGHTEGSLVFLDEENQILFSGDAIGSGGFWMQLPMCTSLTEFDQTAHELYENIKQYDHLTIFPGHRIQSPGELNISYLEDVIYATDCIIDGSLRSKDQTMNVGGMSIPYQTVSYGQVNDYCFDPNHI